jgi:hypothetical protein
LSGLSLASATSRDSVAYRGGAQGRDADKNQQILPL